jgi:putative transposase
MPEYRRILIPGGTYFFTVATYQRRKVFIEPQACELLKTAWLRVSKNHPFITEAFCLLPDHFHCVITLPENENDFSIRIREIKRLFSRSYEDKIKNPLNYSREKRCERYIWQRRFWDHLVRDEKDLTNHIEYIHFNPVKHRYVDQVKDWEYSSFHYFVKKGWLDQNWGEGYRELESKTYGE